MKNSSFVTKWQAGVTAAASMIAATLGCAGGSSANGETGGAAAVAGGAGGGSATGISGAYSAGTNAGGASAAGGGAGSAGGGTSGMAASGSGGQTGGAAGSAGFGGAGSSGISGGGAGGSIDVQTVGQVLDGFALLKPCFSPPGSCAGCTCDENSAGLLNSGAAPENQHITKEFGGDPNVTYDVKLRVVGVAERYWYDGGVLDPTSNVFYTGGLPTIHSAQAPNQNLNPGQGACKIHPSQTDANYPIPFTVPKEVAPADNCYNGFNIFGMAVSSPAQTYFLNSTTDFDGADRQPHAIYKTDYTVTIPISGQAKIDFYVIDGDHHQVANTTMSVPNLKSTEIQQPYSGNFFELQVVDVTVSKGASQ